MRLVRFRENGNEQFGFEKEGRLFSFHSQVQQTEDLQKLKSIESYLEHLPESRESAEIILKNTDISKGIAIEDVELLPVLPHPAGIIDFGLTPTHLKNSALGFISHEFSGLKALIAKNVIDKRLAKALNCETYPYYKGNHGAISGEGDTVVWPSYSAYLDIEPELAFVYGNRKEQIAGFVIYNDLSARDVQFPELQELSLTRSKDFDNGIGSFLVTPDEIEDYRTLNVSVKISDREKWEGDCSDYLLSPDEALLYLETIFTPKTGTLIGMGTIPGTCSIENGIWIEPGESFTITFDHLGSLTQKMPDRVGTPKNSRWKSRW